MNEWKEEEHAMQSVYSFLLNFDDLIDNYALILFLTGI
jgi:hypothetical protein